MTMSKFDMLEKYKYQKAQQLKRKAPCPEFWSTDKIAINVTSIVTKK